MTKVTGGCDCGNVRYEAEGEIDGAVSCHCKQCQKIHGIYKPMLVINKTDLKITEDSGLSWYESSPDNKRGFCKDCGSAIFKKPNDDAKAMSDKIMPSVGSLDDTTPWKNQLNVFCKFKGEYYNMPDGEQKEIM
ncbi:GFA family protein [Candidatus Gracilibacteria bacterium]|nr:GFA family protein [Candidatus Gracilibacteria bacterium]